jgi:hypothetical protein
MTKSEIREVINEYIDVLSWFEEILIIGKWDTEHFIKRNKKCLYPNYLDSFVTVSLRPK